MLKKIFSKKEKKESNNPFSFDFDSDIFWLQRELEFQHQHEKYKFRTNENQSLKLGELVNSLFDIRKEELSALSINDGTLTIIEKEEEIWNYEFLKLYKRNANGEYTYHREGCSKLSNQTVLTLAYRSFDKRKTDKDISVSKSDVMLIIHLQRPDGIKDKSIYIQATFCKPTARYERTKQGINPQPDSLSILIAYDYRSKEETQKEFFDIINSANRKINNNDIDKLKYVEKEIIAYANHPAIGQDFFSGKKAMEENRYWDAISYFENAFNGLQNIWWKGKLNDEEYQMLIESSFLIGYCYFELGLVEKSYKYLEFSAKNSSNGYKYQSEYINCLIALHDIRSIMIIDYNIKSLSEKNQQDRDELHYDFYLFLLRRKSYCLIELNQYEQVEKYLKQILEYDPNNKFAKNEIEYIKDLRNK